MEHTFIRNKDIVMFSFQPWDTEIGSNFKDMALEFARYNRVLFVNRALDRSNYLKHRSDPKVKTRLDSIRKGIGELEQVKPNLWVHNPRVIVESINGIPVKWLHDMLNKINGRRLAGEINKIIAQLELKDVILINDNDFIRGFYLAELIPAVKQHIFYLRDYMLGVSFYYKHGPRHEKGILQKASLVAANSSYLADYARQYNPNSVDIGQGCDLSQFLVTNPPPPEDLANIPGPIIGYTGSISAWRIDADVIRHIAEHLPQYSVVLVGPVDKEFRTEELEQFPNIHFLGAKQPDDLARYVYHFDICINPQILNDVTRGNYPRKVDEYLAMGKPVVATVTEAMKMFEPYTFLCRTPGEYVDKIRDIVGHPERANSREVQEARKQFALSHTWENSIGMLGNAFFNTIHKKQHEQ
ncbi:MAG TPA: glycosyltransferase [Chitinophagaceae bacterium]|nr:glycosyltransferase [Chitinophagaceae bacterium]